VKHPSNFAVFWYDGATLMTPALPSR